MTITSITYAGHSAVLFQFGDKIAAIDPWLEGNPLCPGNLKNPSRLDFIALTHGHADHASDTVRLAKHYGSQVIATYELAMLLIQEGIPQEHVTPMNKGGTVSFDGLSITLTNAFHSSSYDTSTGAVYAGEACGVVLGDGTQNIYHAGDTCMFSDLSLIKELHNPTLAFLPIGDVFTMGPKEAALAAKLVGCRQAVPIHFKTFDLLTGTAEQFATECSKYEVEALVLEPGQIHQLA